MYSRSQSRLANRLSVFQAPFTPSQSRTLSKEPLGGTRNPTETTLLVPPFPSHGLSCLSPTLSISSDSSNQRAYQDCDEILNCYNSAETRKDDSDSSEDVLDLYSACSTPSSSRAASPEGRNLVKDTLRPEILDRDLYDTSDQLNLQLLGTNLQKRHNPQPTRPSKQPSITLDAMVDPNLSKYPTQYPSSSPPLPPIPHQFQDSDDDEVTHGLDRQGHRYKSSRDYNIEDDEDGDLTYRPERSNNRHFASDPARFNIASQRLSSIEYSVQTPSSRFEGLPMGSSNGHHKKASLSSEQRYSLGSYPRSRSRHDLKSFSSPNYRRTASVLASRLDTIDTQVDAEEYEESPTRQPYTSPPKTWKSKESEVATRRGNLGNSRRYRSNYTLSSELTDPERTSGVWEELDAVKERLRRLKSTSTEPNISALRNGNSAINTVNGSSRSTTNNPRSLSRASYSSLIQGEGHEERFKNLSTGYSPVIRSQLSHSSLSNYTQQQQSPTQGSSQAERHLRDVLDRTRRVRGDVNIMLLERAVSDLLAIYGTNCDPQQIDALDRACLSMGSFLLKTLNEGNVQDNNIDTNGNINNNTINNNNNINGGSELPQSQVPLQTPNQWRQRIFLGQRNSGNVQATPTDYEYKDQSLRSNGSRPFYAATSGSSSRRGDDFSRASSRESLVFPAIQKASNNTSSSNISTTSGGGFLSGVNSIGRSRRTQSVLYGNSRTVLDD